MKKFILLTIIFIFLLFILLILGYYTYSSGQQQIFWDKKENYFISIKRSSSRKDKNNGLLKVNELNDKKNTFELDMIIPINYNRLNIHKILYIIRNEIVFFQKYKTGEKYFCAFDLNTRKYLWFKKYSEVLEENSFKEYALNNKQLLVISEKKIISLNIRTGKKNWISRFPKTVELKTYKFYISKIYSNNIMYVFDDLNNQLFAINVNSGSIVDSINIKLNNRKPKGKRLNLKYVFSLKNNLLYIYIRDRLLILKPDLSKLVADITNKYTFEITDEYIYFMSGKKFGLYNKGAGSEQKLFIYNAKNGSLISNRLVPKETIINVNKVNNILLTYSKKEKSLTIENLQINSTIKIMAVNYKYLENSDYCLIRRGNKIILYNISSMKEIFEFIPKDFDQYFTKYTNAIVYNNSFYYKDKNTVYQYDIKSKKYNTHNFYKFFARPFDMLFLIEWDTMLSRPDLIVAHKYLSIFPVYISNVYAYSSVTNSYIYIESFRLN